MALSNKSMGKSANGSKIRWIKLVCPMLLKCADLKVLTDGLNSNTDKDLKDHSTSAILAST
eukprot:4978104-Karenia_brevis.AAC.1